jgi:hypothetical protein
MRQHPVHSQLVEQPPDIGQQALDPQGDAGLIGVIDSLQDRAQEGAVEVGADRHVQRYAGAALDGLVDQFVERGAMRPVRVALDGEERTVGLVPDEHMAAGDRHGRQGFGGHRLSVIDGRRSTAGFQEQQGDVVARIGPVTAAPGSLQQVIHRLLAGRRGASAVEQERRAESLVEMAGRQQSIGLHQQPVARAHLQALLAVRRALCHGTDRTRRASPAWPGGAFERRPHRPRSGRQVRPRPRH